MAESPYFERDIPLLGFLKADQLDNNNFLSLKKNISKEYERKCLQDHGYIVKINEIKNIEDTKYSLPVQKELLEPVIHVGIIASCRICLPMKGMSIIGQIINTNKRLIYFTNGPIKGIISLDRINKKNFKNIRDIIRYEKTVDGNKVLASLQQNDYIKIIIEQIKYNDGKDNMIVLASLDSMATQKEIEMFQKDELLLPSVSK